MGLTIKALERRKASKSRIVFRTLDDADLENITELLSKYETALVESHQPEEANKITEMKKNVKTMFVKAISMH